MSGVFPESFKATPNAAGDSVRGGDLHTLAQTDKQRLLAAAQTVGTLPTLSKHATLSPHTA
ncbi:MAG: hypothetical protein ACKN9T_08575 [Candidatus Methylumidiphilus sp.]